MLGFGATFVAIAWLTLERGWSDWNLPVAALMQRIDRQVKHKNISLTTDDGNQIETPIQLSVGLASSDQVQPEDVLKLADERMYADKERWYRDRKRYR